MKNLNEVKNTFTKFMARFDEKERELDKVMDLSVKELMNKKVVERVIKERVRIYKELMNIDLEFDKWSNEVGLGSNQVYEWVGEMDVYCSKWYCWDTNDIIYGAMLETIRETNEGKINKMIEDARKVLNLVGCTIEEDFNEIHWYLNNLELINTNIRHGIFGGSRVIFAVDTLENSGLWHPYKECFMMGVLKVLEKVDIIFLLLSE